MSLDTIASLRPAVPEWSRPLEDCETLVGEPVADMLAQCTPKAAEELRKIFLPCLAALGIVQLLHEPIQHELALRKEKYHAKQIERATVAQGQPGTDRLAGDAEKQAAAITRNGFAGDVIRPHAVNAPHRSPTLQVAPGEDF